MFGLRDVIFLSAGLALGALAGHMFAPSEFDRCVAAWSSGEHLSERGERVLLRAAAERCAGLR